MINPPVSGINPLVYTGVGKVMPLMIQRRDPTVYDSQNILLGTTWLNQVNQHVWILVSLAEGIAIWVLMTNSPTDLAFQTDSGLANPIAGVIDIAGGSNILTMGATNVVTVSLTNSISLPDTNIDASSGMYSLGGNHFMHDYGTRNTFLGTNAGNLTLTTGSSFDNTGIGYQALTALTTAKEVTAVGQNAGSSVTTGSYNTFIGAQAGMTATNGTQNTCVGAEAGKNIGAGTFNLLLGYQSGENYTSNESGNIILSNVGTLGDELQIRIGTPGEGGQTDCYIAGIYDSTVDPTSSQHVVIDSTGKLGTSGGSGSSVPAFMYYKSTTSTVRTNVLYYLGTDDILQKVYDTGNNFYPGDGAGTRAQFTAPKKGVYQIVYKTLTTWVSYGPGGSGFTIQVYEVPISIVCTSSSFASQTNLNYDVTLIVGLVGNDIGTTVVANIEMDQGDTAQFNINYTDISESFSLPNFDCIGQSNPYVTYVAGSLITELE